MGKCDLIRDLDLGVVVQFDARRLEVVVNGLHLFQGMDTTLVCPLTREGVAKPLTATTSGVRLEVARRRKEARYQELARQGSLGGARRRGRRPLLRRNHSVPSRFGIS